MPSLNEAQIIGHLGRDPEVRYSPNGTAIANVNVATSEQWKDKQTGWKQDKTEWHRLVAFGRTAEIIGEYLKKGSLAYFKGKLQTRKWQDKEGNDKFTTEIVVDRMLMFGSRQNSSGSSHETPSAMKDAEGNDFNDSIPF